MNVSKLNTNIVDQINKSCSNTFIIINCHHKDFWNKIKCLYNYKLIKRKRFIDYKSGYFVTVNIFIRKSFVSLGGNCSVTYQLNKLKLRNKAFPFDWCKIKLTNIIKAFESSFHEFEVITQGTYSENHSSFVVRNKYGIFAHEVIKDGDYGVCTHNLIRRMNRLRSIENPIFIRIETFNIKCIDTYKTYWKKLLILLDSYYSHYQIILISKWNPDLENIRWISYPYFDSDWKNNRIDWWKIFINRLAFVY